MYTTTEIMEVVNGGTELTRCPLLRALALGVWGLCSPIIFIPFYTKINYSKL